MQAKAPAAGGSGEPRSIVVKQHQEGGSVVEGGNGRACSWWALANGTREHSFVHPLVVTSHSVGPGGRLLVMITGLHSGGTGVGIVDVAPMVWQ